MLLDRKRINKWAKWVALFLAIVFAGGFLFLGVGYGGAGFNVSDAFSCAGQNITAGPQTPEQRIEAYNEALALNPNDTTALLGLATVYQQNNDLRRAAGYLEQVIAIDPSQKEIYLRLANIYAHVDVADYASAVTVLNKLTSLDPQNPDVYLKLGTAQSKLGRNEAAILAWQKYLELAPDGEMAPVVREQIDKLSAQATTTTVSTGTTGGTSTTAGTGTTGGGSSSTPGSTTATVPTTTTSTP